MSFRLAEIVPNYLNNFKNHERAREKNMDRKFSAGKTLFDAFFQDLLSMSINLLLALFLEFPRSSRTFLNPPRRLCSSVGTLHTVPGLL